MSKVASNDITALARPEVLALTPYESARSLISGAAASTVYLDANEAPVGERGLNRYPEPQPHALLERFAALYGLGYDVAKERIVMGRGSDEAIDLLVRAFCRPGKDAILISPPTYGMYEVAAAIQGAEVRRVPMLGGRLSEPTLDERALGERLDSGEVKLLFLCSPNNPTGTAIDSDILERLARRARGKALVVVDGAYAEFADGGGILPRLNANPNLVVLRTLSKAWAIAGARCGVAISSPEVIAILQKIRAPYPLSKPAIDAALEATNEAARAALKVRVLAIRAARDSLATELRALNGVTQVFASSANFLLVRFRDPALVMAATHGAGIIIRDRGREVGLEGCIRITVGSSSENAALLKVLREVSR